MLFILYFFYNKHYHKYENGKKLKIIHFLLEKKEKERIKIINPLW